MKHYDTKDTPEIEQAVDILAGIISRDMSDEAADTLLHAIYYLRSGRFPFNRTKK